MNKEFGSTLCDNCHTWFGRGERQLQVVTQGEVINESCLVLPVLELVRMPDDLMKRGAVMICAGMDLRLFYAICTVM